MFIESREVENYVSNVKEQIMNATELNNSEHGLYLLIKTINYYIILGYFSIMILTLLFGMLINNTLNCHHIFKIFLIKHL